MSPVRLFSFWSTAAVFGLVTLSSPAWAYVPPSEYIIKKMVQKRATLKQMRVRSAVMALTSGGGLSGLKFIEETTFDLASGTLRSFALDETGRELYSIERSLLKDSSGREPRTLVSMLLFENRMLPLISVMKRWSIPVVQEDELLKLPSEVERRAAEKTFLGRQKRASGLRVSWVIGEKSSNQLWIEKDTFLPAQLVLQSGDGLLVDFDSYRTVKEVLLPWTMTVHRTQEPREPLFRVEVQDVNVNVPGSIDGKKSVANGFTEMGNSADSEVRELIRHFYSVIR